ncbi:MAG: hypothetical protein ACTSR2_02125, partial [Candidatus Hodarchaeales archaeon]
MTLKTKIDDLSPDITLNSKIKIFLRNAWSTDPRLVYYGYIVSIDPVIRAGEEQTSITCLGAISKLKNDYLQHPQQLYEGQLAYLAFEVENQPVDEHIKRILENYRYWVNDTYGSYSPSMIDDPDNYWSDSNYIDDSFTDKIRYRYFTMKHLDAIKEITKFLPKNQDAGEYFVWYLDDGTDTNGARFHLKKLSTTPDHILQLNKHITSLELRKNLEGMVNTVYFWNEQGRGGEKILKTASDSDSQTLYDRIADRITDSEVTTGTQADLLAQAKLKEAKDEKAEITAVISDADYDILSFKVGDVVDIRDLKQISLFRSLVKTGTADSGTSSTLVDSNLIEADDYWNGYFLKFTSGDNKGLVTEILDFNHSTNTIYFSELPNAVSSGDTYEIYDKDSRLVIQKIVLTPREATLELAVPRPDLTTQVESDREFIQKQLEWFGDVLTRIDATRLNPGSIHWVTEDITFSAPDYRTINWLDGNTANRGSFSLPNGVKRVIAGGTTGTMESGKVYWIYLDEKNCWCGKDVGLTADESGTGSIKRGENSLIASSQTQNPWKKDQWKGYVLWVNTSEGIEKHIIAQNYEHEIIVEGDKPFRTTDSSCSYEIHPFVL